MFFRLLSDCFPSPARCAGLNTCPGNNQLSAFIQTKMLSKLRCREETLLSFSGNRWFKQRHLEILLLCKGRIIIKMCSAPSYLYQACHSRADFWVCLACGLFPGLFKGEGQGADTQSSLHQCFCACKVGGAEIAELQEVSVCHSETCTSSKFWG